MDINRIQFDNEAGELEAAKTTAAIMGAADPNAPFKPKSYSIKQRMAAGNRPTVFRWFAENNRPYSPEFPTIEAAAAWPETNCFKAQPTSTEAG